jgi:hypothetical protein
MRRKGAEQIVIPCFRMVISPVDGDQEPEAEIERNFPPSRPGDLLPFAANSFGKARGLLFSGLECHSTMPFNRFCLSADSDSLASGTECETIQRRHVPSAPNRPPRRSALRTLH